MPQPSLKEILAGVAQREGERFEENLMFIKSLGWFVFWSKEMH